MDLSSYKQCILYCKQMREMPDWYNLIDRCVANDLINKRMMGNQHGLGEEPPAWQPSGYKGGWGWAGAGWGLVNQHQGPPDVRAQACSSSRWKQELLFHFHTDRNCSAVHVTEWDDCIICLVCRSVVVMIRLANRLKSLSKLYVLFTHKKVFLRLTSCQMQRSAQLHRWSGATFCYVTYFNLSGVVSPLKHVEHAPVVPVWCTRRLEHF